MYRELKRLQIAGDFGNLRLPGARHPPRRPPPQTAQPVATQHETVQFQAVSPPAAAAHPVVIQQLPTQPPGDSPPASSASSTSSTPSTLPASPKSPVSPVIRPIVAQLSPLSNSAGSSTPEPEMDPKHHNVWNPDNVKDVAESVGISNLNEDAVRAVSQEAEYRLGQVIVEAMRFMRAGKRTTLSTQDISQALKVLDVEPLYGYESTRPLRFGEASLGPGQPLFYLEDEEIDFEKLINAPLPKVPRDISLTAHWLAVEGVQPSVPQNPTTAEARSVELVPKGPGASSALAAAAGNDNITVKPVVDQILSKELKLLFDKLVAAILDEDEDQDVVMLRAAALESIRTEPALHQLVPYFVNFVAEKIVQNLHNTFILRQSMEIVHAMMGNASLNLEPYINHTVVSILTCLIGRKIGPRGADNIKEVYDLRDFASSLIGHIGKTYGQHSGILRTRIARTLLEDFLDLDQRSTGTYYGCVSGMFSLGGPGFVKSTVIPVLKGFQLILTEVIEERGEDDTGVQMLIGGIMKAVTSIDTRAQVLTTTTNGNTDATEALEEFLGPTIGRRVAALANPKLNKVIFEILDVQRRKDAETARREAAK